MAIRLCFALFLAILLVGCGKLPAEKSIDYSHLWKAKTSSDSTRYQLNATSDGKMFRLDTQTGQTSLVTDKGLMTLPDDQSIQLKVGGIYKLETGVSAIYEGNQKLNTDTRSVDDALIEKWSGKKPHSGKDEFIPAPPPGFILDRK